MLSAVVLPALCGAQNVQPQSGSKKMHFELFSSAFKNGEAIPAKYTPDGDDVSPPLAWKGAPKRTKSLALVMDDPDAPPGTWVHWVIYDISARQTSLPEGLPKKEVLSSGARQGKCWGVDRFERMGYWGPQPPPGKSHHYSFRLYAMDKKPVLTDGATKFDLLKAAEGHILAETELIGLYGR